MAKKKKEEVVEEITEPKQEQPVAEEQKVEEPSNPNEIKEDGTIKVDLDKWAKIRSYKKRLKKLLLKLKKLVNHYQKIYKR